MAASAAPQSPSSAPDDASAVDEQALELRSSGKSFSSIAKALGLERAHDANEAFIRALRRKAPKARKVLREAEAGRLEALATKVKARDDLTPEQTKKRLRSVERLRQTLMMD
ncbi:MAG: hypothetical protein QOJ09_1443 [Actinomycetota bacterium]|jgi:hypothetical protein|nr:hypothetical protein [Actinomycetota bacterium]